MTSSLTPYSIKHNQINPQQKAMAYYLMMQRDRIALQNRSTNQAAEQLACTSGCLWSRAFNISSSTSTIPRAL